MIIRVSNKALIFREGRVLLNKCARADGSGFYYDLPGGGQRPGEAAEDGLRREILEETGCRITEIRFCGLFEEINVNPQDRENYPDYCHRMIHVFTAQYAGQAAEPTEKDFCMLESIWLPLEEGKPAGEPSAPRPCGTSAGDPEGEGSLAGRTVRGRKNVSPANRSVQK